MNHTVRLILKDRWIIAGVCLSALLIVTRVCWRHNPQYIFLIWNLFLAGIPYVIGKLLLAEQQVFINSIHLVRTLSRFFLLCCWLLFLPNAAYIITDFVHLSHTSNAQFIFDGLLLGCFSITGMGMAFKSMSDVKKSSKNDYLFLNSNWTQYLILFLCALGVYLGRVLRWNSWDILQNPTGLFKDVVQLFLSPVSHTGSWLFIVAFTAVLSLGYYIFQKSIHEQEV